MLKKIINTSAFNALVKGKYGYVLYNKHDRYIGKSIETYGEYSEAEIILLKQICQQGDVILEVGSNIGAHTIALSQFVGNSGKIYAFEAQRVIFQTLCANMALNSITNVECYHMAVASQKGFLKIPEIRYDIEYNFGGMGIDKFQEGEKVPLVSLDSLVDVSRVNLIKVDVEGMESQVLTGAKQMIARYKPFLYVENDRVDKSKRLIELIDSFGYRMFWHLPPLFNPHNYAECSDNIFPGIVSVNMLCFHKSVRFDPPGLTELSDSTFHPISESHALDGRNEVSRLKQRPLFEG